MIAYQILLATSLFAADAPAVTHFGLVAPDIVSVTIQEGRVELGAAIPYEAQPGDEIVGESAKRAVVRDGEIVGLVGGSEKGGRLLRFDDRFTGVRADRKLLKQPSTYRLEGPGAVNVEKVFRKSRCVDVADFDRWRSAPAMEHSIYLKLDRPLPPGEWTLSSRDENIAPVTQVVDASTTVSEAVHVSLVGFHPDDPTKHAFLSCWMGDGAGVSYESDDGSMPRFRVIDDASGESVFEGDVRRWKWPTEPADYKGLRARPNGVEFNNAGVTTYVCEFAGLSQLGTYRVVVDGVGSSRPFPIQGDAYASVFRAVRKGLESQRWGHELTVTSVDGTQWNRPAARPERHQSFGDVPVYESTAAYTNANFEEIVAGQAEPYDGSVVGGWMDAGDYDRNHNHYIASYVLLELASLYPEATKPGGLLEHAVDEALWNVDLWVRLQRADGGIPSAVEYSEHPNAAEPSWLNSLPMYVCAPSEESNRDFVIMAAKAASTLERLGRANDARNYRDAAERAFSRLSGASRENAWAAAELAAATGADVFRAALMTSLADVDEWSVVQPGPMHAMITAVSSDRVALDKDDAARFRSAIRRSLTKTYVEGSSLSNPFRALKHGWAPFGWGTGTIPDYGSTTLLRAWKVLGDDVFLDAAVAGIAFPFGANPLNKVFVTGIHDRSVVNVLHCDSRVMGRRSPVGIPIYGFQTSRRDGSEWPINSVLTGDVAVYPEYEYWPAYENFHEHWLWAAMTEYTIHQSFAPVLFYTGVLTLR